MGGDPPGVEFADAADFYRRQGRVIRALVNWLGRNASDGQRVRLVAEQALARRTPAEVTDYVRMEAAANVVYQPFPVSVLCPYGAAGLPADLQPGVERTHPELLEGGRVAPSPAFADPLAAYLVPARHAAHGHGLWLTRQACDCLEVATDRTGTHVRLLTRLPGPGGPEPRALG